MQYLRVLTVLQEWSQLGGQIAETTVALGAAEKEAVEILRNEVWNFPLC